MKVMDLAKELGVTSKDLVVALDGMGHKGMRAMSPLPAAAATELRVKLGRGRDLPAESKPKRAPKLKETVTGEDAAEVVASPGKAESSKEGVTKRPHRPARVGKVELEPEPAVEAIKPTATIFRPSAAPAPPVEVPPPVAPPAAPVVTPPPPAPPAPPIAPPKPSPMPAPAPVIPIRPAAVAPAPADVRPAPPAPRRIVLPPAPAAPVRPAATSPPTRPSVAEPPQEIKRELLKVPESVTVGALAAAMRRKSGEVIKALLELGVMATLNEVLDPTAARLVADKFHF